MDFKTIRKNSIKKYWIVCLPMYNVKMYVNVRHMYFKILMNSNENIIFTLQNKL